MCWQREKRRERWSDSLKTVAEMVTLNMHTVWHVKVLSVCGLTGWFEKDPVWRQGLRGAGYTGLFWFLVTLGGGCGALGEVLTVWRADHIHVAPSGRQLSCFSIIHRRYVYLQVRTEREDTFNNSYNTICTPVWAHEHVDDTRRCSEADYIQYFRVPSPELLHLSVLLLLQFGDETLQDRHFKLDILRHLVEGRRNIMTKHKKTERLMWGK